MGEETINFSLSEDESGLSGYFKFRTSQLEDKDKDKEYNYNDVLPIINKVSKLKEIKETEEDQKEDNNEYNNIDHSRKKSASDIVNNVLDAISNNLIIGDDNDNYNEHNEDDDNKDDDKYKDILNKFREEDNDIIYNEINNNNMNNSKDVINDKPKIIRKNSCDKDKKQNAKKMITFEEFLSKENETK